jgi:transposase
MRKEKGVEIAQKGKITEKNGVWLVPSQTNPRQTYEVNLRLDKNTCTCEDYKERGIRCKHQFAVEITISKQFNKDGTTTITQTKRITYPQNWKAYNTAQINEQELFMKLLSDLCKEVEEPLYTFGRPKLQLRDMVFSSALKVYSTFSLRRFMGDTKIAVEKGYINRQSSFTAVGKYMQNEKLTTILNQLITLSAMPLKNVETKFAVDSSGFRTTKFGEYCKEKHNTKQDHEWIKCHIICGVKTNIITAVEVGFEHHSADSPQFIPLVNATADLGFIMNEVSADKAYSGVANYKAVQDVGGQAYIPFRTNATGTRVGNNARLWRRMFWYYQLKQDEFMQHYHLRSNVESTFFMMKAKFGDLIRSKDRTAQINELLLKVLCHNIVVVNNEMPKTF